MMRIFVNLHWYGHSKKLKLLNKLFKAGLVTRIKQHDGYWYTIPNTTDEMKRILCNR